MRNLIATSGVALAVALMATAAPAQVNLNLGGGGSGVVTLGGGQPDQAVSVGNDAGGGVVNIDTGNGSIGGGDSGNLLNLFGNRRGRGTDIAIDNGGAGTAVDANVLGNDDAATGLLFGPSGSVARVNAVGSDDDAVVRLFGTPGDGSGATGAELALLGGSGDDGTSALITLFGPGAGQGPGGGTGGPGSGSNGTPGVGDSGGDDFGDGTGTDADLFAPNVRGTPSIRVAARGNAVAPADCFTPDEAQVANFRSRAGADPAAWQAAADISLVPVNLCPEARELLEAALAGDGEFVRLRASVAADARIAAALRPGYAPADVLGVDQSGEQLVVYVYGT